MTQYAPWIERLPGRHQITLQSAMIIVIILAVVITYKADVRLM